MATIDAPEQATVSDEPQIRATLAVSLTPGSHVCDANYIKVRDNRFRCSVCGRRGWRQVRNSALRRRRLLR